MDKTTAYYLVVAITTALSTAMVWKIFNSRAVLWRSSPILIGGILAILPSVGMAPTDSWTGLAFTPVGAFALLFIGIITWMVRLARRQMQR